MVEEKVYMIIHDSGREFVISKECYDGILYDASQRELLHQIVFVDIHGNKHLVQRDSILITVDFVYNF